MGYITPTSDRNEQIKKMKRMGTRGKKCSLNKQCTKKYLACKPKKSKKKRSYTYYEMRELFDCFGAVLSKYYPITRKKKHKKHRHSTIKRRHSTRKK